MKDKYILNIFYFIIMVLTWPVFGAWIPLFNRAWVWLGFTFILVFFYVQVFFRSRQFLCILVYSIIIEVFYLMGVSYWGSQINIITEILTLLVTGSLSFHILNSPYYQNNRLFVIWFSVFLFVVAGMSYIINLSFPSIIRENVSYLVVGEQSPFQYLERYGLSNYDIPHALPVLIPVLVYQTKDKLINKRKERLFFGLLVVSCLMLAFISGSTTAFLLSISVTLVSLLVRKGSVRSNVAILILFGVVTLFLMNDVVALNIVRFLDDVFGSDLSLHERFMDIEDSVTYKSASGDLGSRTSLYMESLDSFFSNILWGGGKAGGHSFIFDLLGTTGLLGFISFIVFLYFQVKGTIRLIQPSVRIYYYVSCFAGFLMLAFKNMSNWPMWCFLFIMSPLLLTYNKRPTE